MRYIESKRQLDGTSFSSRVGDVKKIELHSLKGLLPNEEQLDGINYLIDHINSGKTSVSLVGSAGTGKTFCTKILLSHLFDYGHNYRVILAAPTHKAKLVLKNMIPEGMNFSDDRITTIHSLLGLRPDMSIVDFDARDLQFIGKMTSPLFKQYPIYIVDEGSMIPEILYNKFVEEVKSINGVIIFLGDERQLAPVKEDRSNIFDKTDTPAFRLNKIIRQKDENPMTPVLLELRDNPIFEFKTDVNEHGGIIVYDNPTDFLKIVKDKYTNPPIYKNPLKYKVLCYRNARVAQFNKAIRKYLDYSTFFVKGELLMGYDNYVSRNGCDKIFNSNDYVLVNYKKISLDIPFYEKVSGYELKLLDTVDNAIFTVELIDPEVKDRVYQEIGCLLENFRLGALGAKYYKTRQTLWANFYKLKDSFVTFKDIVYEGRVIKKTTLNYGYAMSVHKSQGSTYDEVFIDMDDVLNCPNKAEIRSLQYVAVSRAKYITHLLRK